MRRLGLVQRGGEVGAVTLPPPSPKESSGGVTCSSTLTFPPNCCCCWWRSACRVAERDGDACMGYRAIGLPPPPIIPSPTNRARNAAFEERHRTQRQEGALWWRRDARVGVRRRATHSDAAAAFLVANTSHSLQRELHLPPPLPPRHALPPPTPHRTCAPYPGAGFVHLTKTSRRSISR